MKEIIIKGNFKGEFDDFGNYLHAESKRLFGEYESKVVNFDEKTLKEHIEGMYEY